MTEHKTYTCKAVSAEGEFEAVIATLGVIDKDGDVTMPGAFGTQNVTVLPTHNWGSVPLGKATLFERGNKAVAEGLLNLNSTAGREWHSHLKFDMENGGAALQEWSYGFDIIKSSEGEFEGRKVRFLEELRVHEISPVLVGAGEGTGTLAVKSSGEDKDKSSKKIEKQEEPVKDKLSQAISDFTSGNYKATTLIDVIEDGKSELTDEQFKELSTGVENLRTIADRLEKVAVKARDDELECKALAQYHASETRMRGVLD